MERSQKGNKNQQKETWSPPPPPPAFIWLLEFTESIHSILSASPPLPGPCQGKEHRKPGSSKFQLLDPSLAPALGLCISYHNNNAVKQPSPNSVASSSKHLFSHLWPTGQHSYPAQMDSAGCPVTGCRLGSSSFRFKYVCSMAPAEGQQPPRGTNLSFQAPPECKGAGQSMEAHFKPLSVMSANISCSKQVPQPSPPLVGRRARRARWQEEGNKCLLNSNPAHHAGRPPT